MNLQPKIKPYRIARRVCDQGKCHPVGNQAGNIKQVTGKSSRTDFRKEYGMGTWNAKKRKEAGKLNTVCNQMEMEKTALNRH